MGTKKLTKKRKIFVMYNPEDDVKVKCTPEFSRHWMRRGFIVQEKRKGYLA